jgi:hypothetical protein
MSDLPAIIRDNLRLRPAAKKNDTGDIATP